MNRIFTSMASHVSFQLAEFHRGVVTYCTLMRLLKCVLISGMPHQFPRCSKCRITSFAFVRSDSWNKYFMLHTKAWTPSGGGKSTNKPYLSPMKDGHEIIQFSLDIKMNFDYHQHSRRLLIYTRSVGDMIATDFVHSIFGISSFHN